MDSMRIFPSVLVVIFLAISLQVLFFSPLSPAILEIPSPSKNFTTEVVSNSYLQMVSKLGQGFLDRPEDVAVDKTGVIYTATRDGWIKRKHNNGTWESWKYIGGDTLLGLQVSNDGHIIVCDTEKGLLKVSEDGVISILASHVNGEKIRFADDVVEASDGILYFSVGSTKFGLHEWYLDVLEAKPHGKLLKYNPSLNQTFVLLDKLAFANGVALSADQEYLVVCETWRFRCLKYWLKGDTKGQTEIFIDNLPDAPDNIKLAPDGTFWIALIKEKKQREVKGTRKGATEAMSFSVSGTNPGNQANFRTKFSMEGSLARRSRIFCDHCRRPGHLKEKCWKPHGKPNTTGQMQQQVPYRSKGNAVANVQRLSADRVKEMNDEREVHEDKQGVELNKEEYSQLMQMLSHFQRNQIGESSSNLCFGKIAMNFADLFKEETSGNWCVEGRFISPAYTDK